MHIACRNRGKFYLLDVSPVWIKRHDNGALISCGLAVGEDLSKDAFRRVKKEEITFQRWTHLGCQSRCKLRGDGFCQW